MVPNLNFIVYEMFHEYLLNDSNQIIITISEIEDLKAKNFENLENFVFSNDW